MRAHCPVCTREEFDFMDSGGGGVFRCANCSAESSYATLLDQITAQVMERGKTMLANLKALKDHEKG
jgi:hypothetical protein